VRGGRGRWAILALSAALAGCANDRVALLSAETPGATAGGVVVMDPASGAERGQLTQANTEAKLDGGPVRPRPLSDTFEALLAIMPAPPQVFTLYFIEGTTTVTPESAATLEQLRKIITSASDVQITGYTDTTGDPAGNDKLSLDRAIEIRAALVQDGLPVANAKVTGRGQRDLRVPTGEGVSEPLNRRVEVIIR
jgi:outer membrane protein OmpA-like peptidoglycan-associated protein